jgi:hypothetical protein
MLRDQTFPAMTLDFREMTISERAWYAWRCFERDDRGSPPTVRKLEEQAGLPNATVHRWIKAPPSNPSMKAAEKIAAALKTTSGWLLRGDGAPPTAHTRPPEPYPESYRKKWPTAGPREKAVVVNGRRVRAKVESLPPGKTHRDLREKLAGKG